MCGGGGGRWRVEKERLMGLSLLRKEERRKDRNQFSLRHLRIQMAVRGGKDIKSGNQNNQFISARQQAMDS